MKKIVLAIVITSILFTNCTKETCNRVTEVIEYNPVYEPMSSLRNVVVQAPKSITANGKICTYGNFIFLNEVNKGFHIIDNTNPSNPQIVKYVKVPGNIDLIVKDNYLLADNYVDLLTFDITNPTNLQLVNRKENALPYRQYNYGFYDDITKGIITSFTKTFTTKSNVCNQSNSWWERGNSGGVIFMASATFDAGGGKSANGSQTGSLSRFGLLNNYLYVANRYSITPINIANVLQPIVYQAINIGEVETIYPYKNYLLLGSPTGLFIYNTIDPSMPKYQSMFTHARGCDPVVAYNDKAYVTVRGGGACGGARNTLDVLDISNPTVPISLKTYQMTNPYGVGIYNNKLGICDGTAGFKLYDATTSTNLQLNATIANSKAFDVIMNNNIAILIASDGLYQYNITTSNNPVLLSKLPINP